MQVPKHFAEAGWFADGPNPGETGPAVIAGHVDSTRGPAVFYRLKDLQAGNDIVVTRVDGTTVTFRVARVETYEKQAFPTAAVFGPTPDAELRLVTCGGDFDWSKHSYKSNVVVYATLRLNRPPPRRRVDNTVDSGKLSPRARSSVVRAGDS